MQTELLIVTDSAWIELLSDGGTAVLSEATGDLCFALASSTPDLTAAAHKISPTNLNSLVSFGDIPTGTKAFIKAINGNQTVVVSR